MQKPRQRFTCADGTRGAVEQTRDMPALRSGHWWFNRAPLGAGFNDWHEEIQPTKPAPKRIAA